MMSRTNTSNEPDIILPVAQVIGNFRSVMFFKSSISYLFSGISILTRKRLSSDKERHASSLITFDLLHRGAISNSERSRKHPFSATSDDKHVKTIPADDMTKFSASHLCMSA